MNDDPNLPSRKFGYTMTCLDIWRVAGLNHFWSSTPNRKYYPNRLACLGLKLLQKNTEDVVVRVDRWDDDNMGEDFEPEFCVADDVCVGDGRVMVSKCFKYATCIEYSPTFNPKNDDSHVGVHIPAPWSISVLIPTSIFGTCKWLMLWNLATRLWWSSTRWKIWRKCPSPLNFSTVISLRYDLAWPTGAKCHLC